MVRSCASWLRLLVTALLCVTGVARPVAQRWDARNSVRVHEPMQVSAPTREAELSRLGKRVAVDPAGESPADVSAAIHRLTADSLLVDAGVRDDAHPSSRFHHRAQARGPPAV